MYAQNELFELFEHRDWKHGETANLAMSEGKNSLPKSISKSR